jgi:hypothetical protein
MSLLIRPDSTVEECVLCGLDRFVGSSGGIDGSNRIQLYKCRWAGWQRDDEAMGRGRGLMISFDGVVSNLAALCL